jgi:hypothetical protein
MVAAEMLRRYPKETISAFLTREPWGLARLWSVPIRSSTIDSISSRRWHYDMGYPQPFRCGNSPRPAV